MSLPLRQTWSVPADDIPQHVAIVLSTFARRNNGVFIIPRDETLRRAGLDVYCAFPPEIMPAAMETARNAVDVGMSEEARCLSCAEYDSAHLARINRNARVFGERRGHAR